MKEREALDTMELRDNIHNLDIQDHDSVLLLRVRGRECSVIGGCSSKHIPLIIDGVIGYLKRYRRAYAERHQEKDGEDS